MWNFPSWIFDVWPFSAWGYPRQGSFCTFVTLNGFFFWWKLPSPHLSFSQVSLALICCGSTCVNQPPIPEKAPFALYLETKRMVGSNSLWFHRSAVAPLHLFPVLILVSCKNKPTNQPNKQANNNKKKSIWPAATL